MSQALGESVPIGRLLDTLPADLVVSCGEGINRELPVTSIVADSRAAGPGSLFIAIDGTERDGHRYVASALERGAIAAVVSRPLSNDIQSRGIVVRDAASARGLLSKGFWGAPDEGLHLVGITGTNGKSSVAWILAYARASEEASSLYRGTLGASLISADEQDRHFWGEGLTTPAPEELFSDLAQARAVGASSAYIEVSSHALDQCRVDSLSFDGAIWTNLSRDHLDYHGSMRAYAAAKTRFFSEVLPRSNKPDTWFVYNADDKIVCSAASNLIALRSLSFGQASNSDVQILGVETRAFVAEVTLGIGGGKYRIASDLLGSFHAWNLGASAAALLADGWTAERACLALAAVPAVPGRFERVSGRDSSRAVFVDYAHTPQALRAVGEAVRALGAKRVITVFGCGGDRDKGKRPAMGQEAAAFSDLVIVTSDNPRSEDPMAIIQEIIPGVDTEYVVESDRRSAIEHAIQASKPGDVVLVAGKGHETYQEIAGERLPLSDRDISRSALQMIE